MNVSRLLRTVRYLRPVQIYGRVAHRLVRPTPDLRGAPKYRTFGGRWVAGATRSPAMLDATTFRFLNVEGPAATPSDWDDPAQSRLWRYNLHYFDDLNAADAAERRDWHRALVRRWIYDNPPASGTGWEPYPTSLRIVNWIKWASHDPPGDAFAQTFTDSLAVQTRWLGRRLERHILGNHLWANGKALAFAGVFFVDGEADAWLRLGVRLLDDGLREQILPDGGHFELSPMYSAIILEDVLDIINLAAAVPGRIGAPFVARLRDTAHRMLRWLRVMTHPDGGISFFNDAALHVAPKYDALADYARRLGVPVDDAPFEPIESLRDSGYVRATLGSATLICDVARIGPDYLPGHAHADTLSFELSYSGHRICVNSGTSTYDTGDERARERGTAAHNTVVVDDRDSSEVWAAFRVGRRARPFRVNWMADARAGALRITGSHDGYGRATHTRTWTLNAEALTIEDHVTGTYRTASARFHLAPQVRAAQLGPATVGLATAVGPMSISFVRSTAHIVPSTWHPEFGIGVPNQAIVADVVAAGLIAQWAWG